MAAPEVPGLNFTRIVALSAMGIGVAEVIGEGLGLAEASGVAVALGAAEVIAEGLALAGANGLAVGLGVAEVIGEGLGSAEANGLAEGDPLAGAAERDGLGDAVSLGDGDGLGEFGAAEAIGEALALAEADGLGDVDPLDGAAETDGLGDAVSLGEGDGLGKVAALAEGDGGAARAICWCPGTALAGLLVKLMSAIRTARARRLRDRAGSVVAPRTAS